MIDIQQILCANEYMTHYYSPYAAVIALWFYVNEQHFSQLLIIMPGLQFLYITYFFISEEYY